MAVTCEVCGGEYLRCGCVSQEPYCEQCSDANPCEEIFDADCVIYHPLPSTEPSELVNIGLPNGASAEEIFEKIDDLLGNSSNFPIIPVNSPTIDLTVNGPASHTVKADLKISAGINNQLEVRDDGVYAKPYNENYLVKVNASDAPAYLSDQIVGDTDGIVSISTPVENGQIKVTPSLDIACLLDAIANDQTLLIQLCQLIDKCKCFITITNLSVTFAPACPTGYSLQGGVCVQTLTQTPTISSTIIQACANSYEQYGQYGALIYTAYDPDGTGPGVNLSTDITNGTVIQMLSPETWQNNDHSVPGTSDGNNRGPVNRAGVWRCSGLGTGSLGFSVPVQVPTTKTYYIGIAADDKFQLTVNGVTIVDNTALSPGGSYYLDGGAIYRFWHIYPVTLSAGVNYVGLIGVDTGGVNSILAAEIYDNSLSQLQAASLNPAFLADRAGFPTNSNPYQNLNLVFSTRCARQAGTTFTIGNATCPDSSWVLDTTGGVPLASPCQGINSNTSQWLCKKTITTAFLGYTATIVWDRIPQAISYDVQKKLSTDPDSAYATVTGSPVINPSSGSTVNLIISGLSVSNINFRVRANYGTCFSPWLQPTVIIGP